MLLASFRCTMQAAVASVAPFETSMGGAAGLFGHDSMWAAPYTLAACADLERPATPWERRGRDVRRFARWKTIPKDRFNEDEAEMLDFGPSQF